MNPSFISFCFCFSFFFSGTEITLLRYIGVMRSVLVFLFLILPFVHFAQTAKDDYEVAVYYFPNYHVDSINERWHGKGWTEWDLVKAAKPRFKGHQQPKVPAWGYFDESDPKFAAREIDLAATHGIDVFIYDWYWYSNTGQFLQEGLEKGFLKAPNRSNMKFALMWANHNWTNIHPTPYTNVQEKLTDGEVTQALWDSITSYIVDHYFKQPNYWMVGGKPYFSIFDAARFLRSFSSLDEAAAAMKRFEDKTRQAGFPGVHLNLIDQSVTDNGVTNIYATPITRADVVKALNVSSITSYNFLYAYDLSKAGWPTASYNDAVKANETYWLKASNETTIPYFPNVTMGWDVTPRLIQSDKFDSFRGYPWTPVFNGDNTPEAFKAALQKARRFTDAKTNHTKIITINAWNEWTEGSYLLPDTKTGTNYLESIKAVFGANDARKPK
jgi:hypothetical protein